MYPFHTGNSIASLSLHGQRLAASASACIRLNRTRHALNGARLAASYVVGMHAEVRLRMHTSAQATMQLPVTESCVVLFSPSSPPSAQILRDDLRGTELRKEDGGESEKTKASEKRCDGGGDGGGKRGAH